MVLASPIWLILLAPWATLVVWMLKGRLATKGVPFLELWGREIVQNQRPDRARRRPPPAMLALLAAMLLAIVAAAGPTIRKNAAVIAKLSSDVRMEMLAVRTSPSTQAMVRVVNESDLDSAKLTVRDGGEVFSEYVNLPGRDRARNYFVDLPKAAATVDAEISTDAASGIDHHLQAIRSAAWPIVEGRGALPPELGRMVEVYGRNRRSGEGSKHIAVVAGSENLASDEPTAFVMNSESGGSSLAAIQPLLVRDSPLTRTVDWNRALAGAKVESPPAGEWQPIVSAEGMAAVAVREEPVKEVWVGFDSAEFAHQADFVIFWSNAFDWLGDGGDSYGTAAAAAPATMLLPAESAVKTVPLTGLVFLSALGLMFFSVLTWKAPKFTDGKGFQS
jgi:hypothetical protein